MFNLKSTVLIAALLSATSTAALAEGTHGHSKAEAGHETVMAGDLSITGAFTRETLPNAPVAGGFFTVTNKGQADDRLVGAASDIAGRVEIHEMAMENDVMKMRELGDGLPLPAGKTVMLKPGGYHVMFMDLNQPLTHGQSVEVTLEFENAGKVELTLPVQKRQGAAAHTGHDMKHGQ